MGLRRPGSGYNPDFRNPTRVRAWAGPEMDNFTQVETDEKYSFLVPSVTYGGCSVLNKATYDPHHTHIGLVRPGSAPAGTRPPAHIHTHLAWGARGQLQCGVRRVLGVRRVIQCGLRVNCRVRWGVRPSPRRGYRAWRGAVPSQN